MSGVIFDKILGRIREGGDEGGGGGGNTPKIVTVSNSIYAITDEQLLSLKAGDIVVVDGGNTKYPCLVTFTAPNLVYFYYVYGDTNELVRVKFTKTYGTWNFDTYRMPTVTPVVTALPNNGMKPNTLYNLGVLSAATTIVMAAAFDNDIANVWSWTFSTGATAPTITWPNQITMWADGAAPTIEANKYYEINVMNGLACVVSADIPQQ